MASNRQLLSYEQTALLRRTSALLVWFYDRILAFAIKFTLMALKATLSIKDSDAKRQSIKEAALRSQRRKRKTTKAQQDHEQRTQTSSSQGTPAALSPEMQALIDAINQLKQAPNQLLPTQLQQQIRLLIRTPKQLMQLLARIKPESRLSAISACDHQQLLSKPENARALLKGIGPLSLRILILRYTLEMKANTLTPIDPQEIIALLNFVPARVWPNLVPALQPLLKRQPTLFRDLVMSDKLSTDLQNKYQVSADKLQMLILSLRSVLHATPRPTPPRQKLEPEALVNALRQRFNPKGVRNPLVRALYTQLDKILNLKKPALEILDTAQKAIQDMLTQMRNPEFKKNGQRLQPHPLHETAQQLVAATQQINTVLHHIAPRPTPTRSTNAQILETLQATPEAPPATAEAYVVDDPSYAPLFKSAPGPTAPPPPSPSTSPTATAG